ncbi:MAG TPA: chemotaxis protein CheB [Stellaceae bacterium]|nr:chemotaxis protein CheB [Stellaceae bacterium]
MAQHHDIVAIGTSAGGFHTLQSLLRGLPAELPAAVFIVMHVGSTSHLAQLLDQAGPLRVKEAECGEPIVPGRVYVAGPGRHLLLHDGHILLRRGPRENMARPAIDPLFRSAACSFGARVVGVVLSGALNDGTAGLMAVKRCGGVAVVQDPADAAVPSMPQSALRHVEVDHCVPIAAMPDLLARLAAEPAGKTPEIPLEIRIEAAIAAQELSDMSQNDRLGKPSRFGCPECRGTLWEIADGGTLRYRCHVGHAYSGEALLAAQASDVHKLLRTLLRSHQERAELARRVAAAEPPDSNLAALMSARAREYDRDAELMQQLLRERNSVPRGGARAADIADDGQQEEAIG